MSNNNIDLKRKNATLLLQSNQKRTKITQHSNREQDMVYYYGTLDNSWLCRLQSDQLQHVLNNLGSKELTQELTAHLETDGAGRLANHIVVALKEYRKKFPYHGPAYNLKEYSIDMVLLWTQKQLSIGSTFTWVYSMSQEKRKPFSPTKYKPILASVTLFHITRYISDIKFIAKPISPEKEIVRTIKQSDHNVDDEFTFMFDREITNWQMLKGQQPIKPGRTYISIGFMDWNMHIFQTKEELQYLPQELKQVQQQHQSLYTWNVKFDKAVSDKKFTVGIIEHECAKNLYIDWYTDTVPLISYRSLWSSFDALYQLERAIEYQRKLGKSVPLALQNTQLRHYITSFC